MELHFTQRAARNGSLLIGLSIVLVVESIAVHALVRTRWPVVDLILIVFNLGTMWYLVEHYRAIGRTPIVMNNAGIEVRHGTSIHAHLPWAQVRRVLRPDFKAQPADTARQYLKLSGGDDPNVLIMVDPPVTTHLMLGFKRDIALFGLRLDEPDRFVAGVSRSSNGLDAAPSV